jgi:hypothetical protein
VSSYRESLRAWNVSCSFPAGGINDEGKDARRRVKHNRQAKGVVLLGEALTVVQVAGIALVIIALIGATLSR